jgi:cell division septation protein DedD
MADEGLHEIQLNGKQLVFLFMASTVVAVVIFLCGVMVGRGVRAQRPGDAIETPLEAAGDPTASAQPVETDQPPAATTPSNAPTAANEILTYPERLEGHDLPEEPLKPKGTSASRAASPATNIDPTARVEAATKVQAAANPMPTGIANVAKPVAGAPRNLVAVAEPVKAQAPPEPAGNGFVVQVAAVNDRREADSIAKRLASKGYPTFVTTPRGGVPKMFRVRVGKYQTRKEAERTASRLQKEDQFKPWITR